MKDFTFFIITTFLFLLTHSLSGQNKTSDSHYVYPDGNKYQYMNKLYSYNELGPKFIEHKEFITLHQKALKKRKSATIWGTLTIGVGLWGAVLASNCEGLGCIALILPMGIGSITGTIALIQLASSSKLKSESLPVLNNSLSKGDLGFKGSSSLSISAGINGIGLVYRF